MQYAFSHAFFYYTASNLQSLLSNYCKAKVICLESTTSTNDILKEQIKNNSLTQETILISLEQTKGRGQFNRAWASKKSDCLMLSFCMPISKVNSAFSLVCGICVQQALNNNFNLSTNVKWANDIIWQHKKLAGLLVEVVSRGEIKYIIIGLGLNWITPKIENNKNKISAIGLDNYLYNISIKNICNFIADLIKKWQSNLYFCQNHGFSSFVPLWNEIVYQPNIHQVFSRGIESKIQGKYHHINELGELFILNQDNILIKV